jgi:hypothetical protein
MQITDIGGVTQEAANMQDLELILNRRRDDGLNSFWLCNPTQLDCIPYTQSRGLNSGFSVPFLFRN